MLIPSIIASIGLSAATLETILFHHAMTTKLPSDKINYHNVFKQYFQKSPTGLDGEVTIVRWDVGVVFLLFWSLAACIIFFLFIPMSKQKGLAEENTLI